ncbi:rhodanese [Sphingomonas sp. Leaf339]|uniref:rhodanese n=1 Tax=Sphingomonas sp. Leaf339 TaxID=1736343 RepID=UPI000700858E|nr:rhodanese [Sphingomonas sp. Leaf339]KQU46980.1 rhodanese [Sphingomonas sp. Leaf339]
MVSGRLLALAALVVAPVQDTAFDPVSGYRIAAYRGVVPDPPPGVPQINAAAVAALGDRAVLIDVVPAEGAVRDTATGMWRLARPAVSIPRAHWFPEAGRGVPDPAIARWFLDGVRTLAAAQPRAPIVVFCLADCWMSWNAALRLRRAGYTQVRWFAEGSDGWRDLGRGLVPVAPYRATVRRR